MTSAVESFYTKVSNTTDSSDMEKLFTLKAERESIEDMIDLYEDELEYLYHQGTLTSAEYRSYEKESDLLDNKLDDAEDLLERTFNIRD